MEKNLSCYKEILFKNGIKYTKQKELILSKLILSNSHSSADGIYQRIKDRKIGLATVYRNLKLFEKLGIIKVIPLDGVNYYELKIYSKKPLHIHFKCSKCNVMIDIDDTNIILEYIKLYQKVERKTGYEVNDANITLLGVCNICREEQNAKTNEI
ncbi:MAG: Fur family transcriptional regulator [Mobilitalea sp.]